MMKINWKLRVKSKMFWIGVITLILNALGVTPEMLTSWGILEDPLKELVSNPYRLFMLLSSLAFFIVDYKTKGLSDSEEVLKKDL